jgi:hypothetical protein
MFHPSVYACRAPLLAAIALLAPQFASADPWIPPLDARLRHDIQLLADEGVILAPVTSWPMSWPTVARAVLSVESVKYDPAVALAIERLRAEARHAMQTDEIETSARVSLSEAPSELRTFSDRPREQGELRLEAASTGRRFAWRFNAEYAPNPSDDEEVRFDGSYLGVSVGNWMVSAGYMEKWWGPGWEGSLIMGTGARPVPSITIERNYSEPFKSPLLSWIGPWRISFQMGKLEGDRADFPNARLFALRVNSRPFKSLEIGLSRTAQWCGRGRPCGARLFWDLFTGNDNNQPLAQQPGNQLAGFDARWKLPGKLPIAVYGQMIGEDEAGFLPSKYLGLFGAEAWWSEGEASWRTHFEYADTACNFMRQQEAFGCAYESTIYTEGYTHRQRSIGHAMGGDSRMYSVGALRVDARGNSYEFLARKVELNRGGKATAHPITLTPVELLDVELAGSRGFKFGTVRLGVGYSDVRKGTLDDGLRAFLEWRTPL